MVEVEMAERYVIDNLEVLRRLHRHGRGVIHNPSDKHMHHAACDDIKRMTVGTKKWFPSYSEARAYLDDHQARWGGHWTRWDNCTPSAAQPADPAIYLPLVGAGRGAATGSRAPTGSADDADVPLDRPDTDAVEVIGPRDGSRSVQAWSDIYLPFEPKTGLARDLRSRLRRELR